MKEKKTIIIIIEKMAYLEQWNEKNKKPISGLGETSNEER